MYFRSKLNGKLVSTDANFSSCYISNLSTPLGVYKRAMLRTSDMNAIDITLSENIMTELINYQNKLHKPTLEGEQK